MQLLSDARIPRYHILAPIGTGSMGEVFRARDRLSGHVIALKRVTREIEGDESDSHALRLALAHEFRTLAGLRHPHIISVLDYGFDSAQQPYFTMELLEDASPLRVAAQGLPLTARVELLDQVLEALAYLHRRGVLHHDLKPENVLVAGQRARLLDFGLAALASQRRDDDTFGTLLYLAPEVLAGQPYTEASDLYSVGVIAYELFGDRHPFAATTISEFLQRVNRSEVDLASLSAPPAVRALIQQLLARDPAERPASAHAAIAALRAAAGLPPRDDQSIRESYLQAAAFVGRDAELALLTAALGQARAGRGSAHLVGGESGVGKSRLLRELATEALVAGATVIRSQVTPDGGASYQLWREVLRQLAIISPAIDDLSAGVILPLVPDLAELIGRPVTPAPPIEGQAAQLRLLTTIADLLGRQERPIALLLEDLQWADESLLPLQFLLRGIDARPLLVIGTYRDDERPGLPAELPAMAHMTLTRLSPSQVADLSAAMLGDLGRQPDLLDRLQRETEGNTFFLVEVVRALAEEAGDLSSIGRVSLPPRLLAGGVQAVIRRRIDRAPSWAQPALQAAAAIGREVDARVLQTILPALDLQAWLSACADAAMLEVQSERWQFSHDKLRDELLGRLAPDALRALHRAVAEASEQIYGADDDRAGQLAFHWGQAGDTAQELRACQRGARYAQRQGSLAEAARLLSRAIELAPADAGDLPVDLHIRRGEVRVMLTARAEAEQDFRAALELAREPAQAASALLALGRLARVRSEYEAALAWLARAEEISTTQGDARGLAHTLSEVGFVWHLQSDYAHARASLDQALDYARAADDQAATADALLKLGSATYRISEYPQSHAYHERALAIYERLGDLQGIASCLQSQGMVFYSQGDYQRARDLTERGLALRRAAGNKGAIPALLNSLANADANLGELERARERYAESLKLAREIDAAFDIATALNNLGSLIAELGEHAAARELLQEALDLRRALNDSYGVVSVLNNLGGVAYYLSDFGASQRAYVESAELALSIGDRDGVAYNLAGMAMVADALGDSRRAALLGGATMALLASIGGALGTDMQQPLDRAIEQARAALGDGPFEAAWWAGQRMRLEEVLEYARASEPAEA